MVHCYSEGPDELPAWLDLGLFISFAGTVTYPGSDRLRAAAALVPVDRLLAETDAPYLAPQNARGRRNEPLYVAATHAALARERGVDIGDLAAQIAGNARMLFGERWEPGSPPDVSTHTRPLKAGEDDAQARPSHRGPAPSRGLCPVRECPELRRKGRLRRVRPRPGAGRRLRIQPGSLHHEEPGHTDRRRHR